MEILEQPIQIVVLLLILSLLPLLLVLGSSFLKLAVVLSLFRNALGIQQIPPNIALYGLALVLTLFTMAPVGLGIQDNLIEEPLDINSPDFIHALDTRVLMPYREFLDRNSAPDQVRFFTDIGQQIWPEKYRNRVAENSLLILMPAFAVSQLIEAFKIGLLLFLPFIAIDLIVANILLAMGMMMVSPMTISMPLKLLIFVIMGGWEKLLHQLILSFS